jgi:3',5'-cyclic-AMP phosphodiesterase
MRFIVIGDTKGKENGINEKVLKSILHEICKLKPEPQFIVMCGDSVAGSSKEDVLAHQLQSLKLLIEKHYKPITIIPVVGNHEVNRETRDDRFEKVISQVYCELNPDSFLKGYNRTVYSIDFDDTRLIILNAFHYNAIHKIEKEQLDWLEEKASEPWKNKIVFVHSPAFPTGAHLGHSLDLYPEDRDAFWKIVDKCGVDIVFSGHEHNYSRRIINSSFNKGRTSYKRNVYQVITGGGGEKLKNKYNSKEGIVIAPIDEYHFMLVDIESNYIKIAAVSSKGKIMDEFRIDKTTTYIYTPLEFNLNM